MIFTDSIYGPIEIIEPVILELINCPALQRLKKIDQGGYTTPYQPGGRKFSRFDHSVGVYWLLKKFAAPLEEQVAGLIHDVSHSAFSHCIDYVLNEGNGKQQSHQDNIFKSVVKKSEIPKILKKYQLEPSYIFNDFYFPLKEQPLPDLCADRIDYSLRTAVCYQYITSQEAQKIIENLTINNNRWVFSNWQMAQKYAELFLELNTKHYASQEGVIMHQTVRDYLRYALNNNYISQDDLYTTDDEVLAKIAPFHNQDKKLLNWFTKMNNPQGYKNNPRDYDVKIYLKSRIVDPLCQINGQVKNLSGIIPDWKGVVENESKPKVYYLKSTS